MVAPGVDEVTVTGVAAKNWPASGLKVGGAIVGQEAHVTVYALVTTLEGLYPLSYAMAMIGIETVTVIGPVYNVPVADVGAMPFSV
jgi:hypothetical protein